MTFDEELSCGLRYVPPRNWPMVRPTSPSGRMIDAPATMVGKYSRRALVGTSSCSFGCPVACTSARTCWDVQGPRCALYRQHITSPQRFRTPVGHGGSAKKNRLATCVANLLIYLAPRPGLEPGTYGLTGYRSICPLARMNAHFPGFVLPILSCPFHLRKAWEGAI